MFASAWHWRKAGHRGVFTRYRNHRRGECGGCVQALVLALNGRKSATVEGDIQVKMLEPGFPLDYVVRCGNDQNQFCSDRESSSARRGYQSQRVVGASNARVNGFLMRCVSVLLLRRASDNLE